MVERRETFHRARELGVTVARHAESIHRDEELDLRQALDKALHSKVGKGDPDYDEVRRLAIENLKARGLIKQPKAEPERIVIEESMETDVESPKIPEPAPTRLKDLPEKKFQSIVNDAARAEKLHPADALGLDEEEI